MGATAKTKSTSPIMSLDDLLEYVNERPDEVPHLAITGPSGAGKTTLAVVVLANRPGLIVAISGKEEDIETKWRGLYVTGIDDDLEYTGASEMFDELLEELKRRNLRVRQRKPIGDWLTVVVDDFGVLKGECPAAPKVITTIARIGRSLKVRLILLSATAQVAELGISGEGGTRDNFVFVHLNRGHTGTVKIEDKEIPVDFSLVAGDHEDASLRGREWPPHIETFWELLTRLFTNP